MATVAADPNACLVCSVTLDKHFYTIFTITCQRDSLSQKLMKILQLSDFNQEILFSNRMCFKCALKLKRFEKIEKELLDFRNTYKASQDGIKSLQSTPKPHTLTIILPPVIQSFNPAQSLLATSQATIQLQQSAQLMPVLTQYPQYGSMTNHVVNSETGPGTGTNTSRQSIPGTGTNTSILVQPSPLGTVVAPAPVPAPAPTSVLLPVSALAPVSVPVLAPAPAPVLGPAPVLAPLCVPTKNPKTITQVVIAPKPQGLTACHDMFHDMFQATAKENFQLATEPTTSVKVEISTEFSKANRNIISANDRRIVKHMALKNYGYAANAIWSDPEMRMILSKKLVKSIENELGGLCSIKQPSIVRDTSPKNLMSLSAESLTRELKSRAPTFYNLLDTLTSSRKKTKKLSHLRIISPAMVILKARNPAMCAWATCNRLVLEHYGCPNTSLVRLCKQYITTRPCNHQRVTVEDNKLAKKRKKNSNEKETLTAVDIEVIVANMGEDIPLQPKDSDDEEFAEDGSEYEFDEACEKERPGNQDDNAVNDKQQDDYLKLEMQETFTVKMSPPWVWGETSPPRKKHCKMREDGTMSNGDEEGDQTYNYYTDEAEDVKNVLS